MKKPRGIRKPKGYQPGNTGKNYHLAVWDSLSPEAVGVFKACRHYDQILQRTIKLREKSYSIVTGGYDRVSMRALGIKQSEVDAIPASIGIEIANRILCGLKKRDGYFFRDLARICEWDKIGVDHSKELIAMMARDGYKASVPQIEKILAQRRRLLSQRRIHKDCKKLGYDPAPAEKPGRSKAK